MNGKGANTKLWPIDLFGSKCVLKTYAQCERLKGGQNIFPTFTNF